MKKVWKYVDMHDMWAATAGTLQPLFTEGPLDEVSSL
jgi:hypothetical protein